MEHEEDEPAFEELANADLGAASKGIVLTIDGYDAGRIEGAVVERLAAMYAKDLAQRGAVKVDKILSGALEIFIATKLGAAAESVLDEGWHRTDEYGVRTGNKITLKDRIGEMLSKKNSNYSNSQSWIDRVVDEKVSALLTHTFKRELDEATSRFRKQVDELLAGKIAEGLRSALGLGR